MLTVFLMMGNVELYKVRIIASIGCVALWTQMFFWMRLFDSLAQYVDLIIQTVEDIQNFLGVMLELLFMFGSGLYLLNLNRL